MAGFDFVIAYTLFDIYLTLGYILLYWMAVPFYYAQQNQFWY